MFKAITGFFKIVISSIKSIFIKEHDTKPIQLLIKNLQRKKRFPSFFFKKFNSQIDKQISVLKSYKEQDVLAAKTRVLRHLKSNVYDVLDNLNKIIFDIKLQLQLYSEFIGKIEEYKNNHAQDSYFSEISDRYKQKIKDDINHQIKHPMFQKALKSTFAYYKYFFQEFIENIGTKLIDDSTLYREFAKLTIWTNDSKIIMRHLPDIKLEFLKLHQTGKIIFSLMKGDCINLADLYQCLKPWFSNYKNPKDTIENSIKRLLESYIVPKIKKINDGYMKLVREFHPYWAHSIQERLTLKQAQEEYQQLSKSKTEMTELKMVLLK